MFNTVRTSGQLGPILRRLRIDKGWSQLELGKKIGLSQERISAIENHPEKVAIDRLLTVLMALDAELLINHRVLPSAMADINPDSKGNPNKSMENW